MYTRTSRSSSLWFESALLTPGWTERVRITIDEGRIGTIDIDVDAASQDERHAIGIPGTGNVHSHAFQRALAGLTEQREGADNFWSWREAMYGLVARLTPSQIETIAAQAYVEMLESGITRVGEFHYLHHDTDGRPYSDIAELGARIAAAADASGIGLTLLPVFYAHGGIGGLAPQLMQRRFVNSLDGYLRLIEASNRAVQRLPFANVGLAAHSVRAVTPEELTALSHVKQGGPVHMHIAEQPAEVEQWQQWAGARPVEWLLDHVRIDDRWCLVHATHVTQTELERLVAAGATVGLCPITEANLGDGLFPLRPFLTAGGRFGIGTDSNVLIDFAEELRLLEYGQRLQHRERNVVSSVPHRSTGRALLDHALVGGAHALHRQTGQLAPGFVADIVALTDEHPSVSQRGDALLDSWIFAGAPLIDCVWSAGRKVVENGRHRHYDRIARSYRSTLRELAR